MASGEARVPPQARLVFAITAEEIANSAKRLIETSRLALGQIVANVSLDRASFDNVLLPLAQRRNSIASESHVLSFYKEVSADAALRAESRASKLTLENFDHEIAMREDLFKLVEAVATQDLDLDPESQKLLRVERQGFLKNGLGITAGSSRDRFRGIKKRLNEVLSELQRNMVEENGGLDFSRKELVGLPQDFLESLTSSTASDSEDSNLRVRFKSNHASPILRYAESSETRKRYLIAYENRCNQNVPLFREAVLLRDEAARMLGHTSHAAFRVEELVSESSKDMLIVLNEIQARLQPACQAELQALKALKQSHLRDRGIDFDDKFYVWDFSYYHRWMLESQFAVDQQGIAEYFPIETVVPAMLGIFEHLFGLVFESVSSDTAAFKAQNLTWHEDVQLFDVWDSADRGGGFLGFMYLDLFSREGKSGNAANFNLQPGYAKPDNTRHCPSTALVCNVDKPLPDRPSLLQHNEVVMLFHELGHGIHDLVAKTRFSHFHGTTCADDFCEAPSQMLERWCWSAPQLGQMGRHYSTLSQEYREYWQTRNPKATAKPSEQIPNHMIEALLRSERVDVALTNMRSLWRALFDLRVHAPPDRETLEIMDITREFNTLRRDLEGLDMPEDLAWSPGQATFTHLMGGYDASFYGYLLSRVYASDMFRSAFARDPMDPKVGRRYRERILEKGGSRDEMELLREFLGRSPKLAAFYRELGVWKT